MRAVIIMECCLSPEFDSADCSRFLLLYLEMDLGYGECLCDHCGTRDKHSVSRMSSNKLLFPVFYCPRPPISIYGKACQYQLVTPADCSDSAFQRWVERIGREGPEDFLPNMEEWVPEEPARFPDVLGAEFILSRVLSSIECEKGGCGKWSRGMGEPAKPGGEILHRCEVVPGRGVHLHFFERGPARHPDRPPLWYHARSRGRKNCPDDRREMVHRGRGFLCE